MKSPIPVHSDSPSAPLGISSSNGTLCGNDAPLSPRSDTQQSDNGVNERLVELRQPDFEVVLDQNDPKNPRGWSTSYRAWVIATVSFSAWVVVLYSTSYMSSVLGLQDELGVSSLAATTGLTTYLLGLALGSLLSAPLSELYGRRIVYILSLFIWILLIIPCGLAESFTAILVARFFGGVAAAALVSNGPGSIVDVSKPDQLALGMSLYSLGPFSGPVLGPLIGGVAFQYLDRRWTNWIVLALGVLGLLMMLTVMETYVPLIMRRETLRRRRETKDPRWWCQYDRQVSAFNSLRTSLCRPVILFIKEPTILFINTWNAVIYGVLYLCFVAYPVVFYQHREWNSAMAGMCYLGIGAGIVLAVAAEPLIRRTIQTRFRDPQTNKASPEAVAVVMVIGSLLTPIGQFGFAWTCLPRTIHWIAPILFGIPFGAGNTICFIYSSSYLGHLYTVYTASAMASNAVIRSIFGAVLPLVGAKMYESLSPQMAGTVCGVLLVLMIPIPFTFWRYGDRFRKRSKTVKELGG